MIVGEKLLRLPEVVAKTGLSKTTIWRYEKRGSFPKRVIVTERTVAWRQSEIEAFIKSLG